MNSPRGIQWGVETIMSLENKLLELVQTIGADMHELFAKLDEIAIGPPLSIARTNEDANGIFTTVSHYRPDSTLYKTSVLTGGTSPSYTTRTVTYYEEDGSTVKSTQVYALGYNGSGVLITETLQP